MKCIQRSAAQSSLGVFPPFEKELGRMSLKRQGLGWGVVPQGYKPSILQATQEG